MAKTVRLDVVILAFVVLLSCFFMFGDIIIGGGSSRGHGASAGFGYFSSSSSAADGSSSDGGYDRASMLSQNDIRAIVERPAGSGVPPGIPPMDNPFPTAEKISVAELEKQSPPINVIGQAVEGHVSLLALAEDVEASIKAPRNPKSMAVAEKVTSKIQSLMQSLYDETATFADHDSYIIIRRAMQNALLQSRRKFMVEAAKGADGGAIRARTSCFQFVRDDQTPRDAISRIPCIPWDSHRLHTVALGRYGVLSQYHHIDPPTDAQALADRVPNKLERLTGRPPLRIGVAMSGQMRTYRRCYQSIVDNVLKTNDALLFIASYPDVGDKRFGVRILERDDEVPAGELAHMFGPYLASMYTADLPTVTRRLHGEFPTQMVTTQHSWMVYQIFMMDLAQAILLRHSLGPMWTDGTYAPFVVNKQIRLGGAAASGGNGGLFSATPWPSFDVVVRIRPDLYILGPMWVRSLTPTSAVFNFSCGNHTFSRSFSSHEVLRTPHHPYYRWVLDPISDHSAIGFTPQVTKLFELYKDARAMEPSQQTKEIFFFGNTVERMWTQHIERKKLTAVEVFGWHFMLRNPSKFLNSSHMMSNSERRRKLMMNIFAISDPNGVECPPRDGKMWVLPPKKRGGR